jgi:hypothetical protein
MHFRSLIHQLVHRQRKKIAEHDVHDGTQPGHCRADSHSGEPGLRNRRVEHALAAKFLHQARQNFERRSCFGHVFAENAHARVAPHLFGKRFSHRLRKCHFA